MYALKHFSQWSTTYLEPNVEYTDFITTKPITASNWFYWFGLLYPVPHYYGITVVDVEANQYKIIPDTKITTTARTVIRSFFVGK